MCTMEAPRVARKHRGREAAFRTTRGAWFERPGLHPSRDAGIEFPTQKGARSGSVSSLTPRFPGAVQRVPDNPTENMGEMKPNLVGATRLGKQRTREVPSG